MKKLRVFVMVIGVGLLLVGRSVNCSFEEALAASADAEAVDCSQSGRMSREARRSAIYGCLARAIESGQPFRYDHAGATTDSIQGVGLFGTGEGPITRLYYDNMRSTGENSYEHISRKVCRQPRLADLPSRLGSGGWPIVECDDWGDSEEICVTGRFWLMADYYRDKLHLFLFRDTRERKL